MFDAVIDKPRPRRWQSAVIIGSAAAHAVVFAAVVVGAMWKIDKLDPGGHTDVTFRVPPPPGDPAPPPAGRKLAVQRERDVTRPVKVKPPVPVQPTIVTDPTPSPTAGGDADQGERDGDGDGPDGDGDDPTATGTCTTPPCVPGAGASKPECADGVDNDGDGLVDAADPACKAGRSREGDDPVAQPPIVPPNVARGLRLSGNDQILPPELVRVEMLHQGKTSVQGTVQLCVSPAGAVTQVRVLRSTGFRAYDDVLAREMRAWRYRPYLVGGVASPMCTVAIVIYRMRT